MPQILGNRYYDKRIKKKEKATLVSFGIGDFGDEIGMLTEMSTLQDVELFCVKRRLKIKKKLEIFRKKRKNNDLTLSTKEEKCRNK